MPRAVWPWACVRTGDLERVWWCKGPIASRAHRALDAIYRFGNAPRAKPPEIPKDPGWLQVGCSPASRGRSELQRSAPLDAGKHAGGVLLPQGAGVNCSQRSPTYAPGLTVLLPQGAGVNCSVAGPGPSTGDSPASRGRSELQPCGALLGQPSHRGSPASRGRSELQRNRGREQVVPLQVLLPQGAGVNCSYVAVRWNVR